MTDIKTLNDNLRQTFTGGRVMLTAGINAKLQDDIAKILSAVRQFNHFTKGNLLWCIFSVLDPKFPIHRII